MNKLYTILTLAAFLLGGTVATTAFASEPPPEVLPEPTQQDVIFNTSPTALSTDANRSLSATATSGLTPVTFSVTAGSGTVCALTEGNMLDFLAPGTCEVTATQSGNGTYMPASSPRTITVSFPPTAITGVVYDDTNIDYEYDSGGDPLLSGWTITATPYVRVEEVAHVDTSRSVKTVTTGADGVYTFTFNEGEIGEWRITETVQTDWAQTEPNFEISRYYTVRVAPGDTTTGNFGNYKAPTVEISAWNDANRNGVRDTGELPLVNWPLGVANEYFYESDDEEDYFSMSILATGITNTEGVARITLPTSRRYKNLYVVQGSTDGWTRTYPTESQFGSFRVTFNEGVSFPSGYAPDIGSYFTLYTRSTSGLVVTTGIVGGTREEVSESPLTFGNYNPAVQPGSGGNGPIVNSGFGPSGSGIAAGGTGTTENPAQTFEGTQRTRENPAVAFGSNSTGNGGSTSNGAVAGVSTFKFLNNMSYGSRLDPDVDELHKVLIAKGYLKIKEPTGWFGPLTRAAVKMYQKEKGIAQTGVVGEQTRDALNTGE